MRRIGKLLSTTEKVLEGGICIRLSDGRVLFTRYTRTVCGDIRDTPIGPFNFGFVRLGPSQEWIRDPARFKCACRVVSGVYRRKCFKT